MGIMVITVLVPNTIRNMETEMYFEVCVKKGKGDVTLYLPFDEWLDAYKFFENVDTEESVIYETDGKESRYLKGDQDTFYHAMSRNGTTYEEYLTNRTS